ncbi:hypothetical protein AJ85_07725 [Alkalihalobacillus alcalophilus ATCC 27647 = CGMCC 1.3604]|uniref:PepSY domain-containing protein n=1 Tax=Alkalihalobacillus alcalophilus ATCC 27647 = CGMCC 1.3604 TaxID=1218173 RepID=A0A094WFW3_ALKAL|nr:hypothetical protein [Alkalihalobacillus alcalophilus]KGA96664.1 hypothetical protein BALCAV_0214915 [Alkalihalobacillus alcalophilus ATCC 27647 = CGMCC 1.3604]MED1561824.1 hypothetical protein [Alkalihalobacillus alcalophilus]THG91010.1 hypothetical protein AJ85_07725 [Alkalihalobacillus alcalophilus ATCC 27647 = CGMCC 1.3604]
MKKFSWILLGIFLVVACNQSGGSDSTDWELEGFVLAVDGRVMMNEKELGLVSLSNIGGAKIGDYLKVNIEALMESYPSQANVTNYKIEEPHLPESASISSQEAIQMAYPTVLEELGMASYFEGTKVVSVYDAFYDQERNIWVVSFSSSKSGDIQQEVDGTTGEVLVSFPLQTEAFWIEGYVSSTPDTLVHFENSGLVFVSGVSGAEIGDFIRIEVEAILESWPGQAHPLDFEIVEPEQPEGATLNAKEAIQEAYPHVLENLGLESTYEGLHYVTVQQVDYDQETGEWLITFSSTEEGEIIFKISDPN